MRLLLTSDLISESLRLDDRDVIDDSLVGVEITSEFTVVSLDDGLGCSLNSLGSNSSLYSENIQKTARASSCSSQAEPPQR